MKFLTAIVNGFFKLGVWILICSTILTIYMMYLEIIPQ